MDLHILLIQQTTDLSRFLSLYFDLIVSHTCTVQILDLILYRPVALSFSLQQLDHMQSSCDVAEILC